MHEKRNARDGARGQGQCTISTASRERIMFTTTTSVQPEQNCSRARSGHRARHAILDEIAYWTVSNRVLG